MMDRGVLISKYGVAVYPHGQKESKQATSPDRKF